MEEAQGAPPRPSSWPYVFSSQFDNTVSSILFTEALKHHFIVVQTDGRAYYCSLDLQESVALPSAGAQAGYIAYLLRQTFKLYYCMFLPQYSSVICAHLFRATPQNIYLLLLLSSGAKSTFQVIDIPISAPATCRSHTYEVHEKVRPGYYCVVCNVC